MNQALKIDAAADPDEGWSLPAWTYHDPEFYRVEMERVMRPSWQVVCHLSDIAEPGQWHTLEFLGESIIVVRGKDGAVRAFTNVCRHRGSRIVDGSSGCARKLVCPYHAWTYNLDGTLAGVPGRSGYPGLGDAENGLAPVEMEVWHGFVFVRLESGAPSVREMMAPYGDRVAPCRFEELEAVGRVPLWPRRVNWTNVAENCSDGLHSPSAQPAFPFSSSAVVNNRGRRTVASARAIGGTMPASMTAAMIFSSGESLAAPAAPTPAAAKLYATLLSGPPMSKAIIRPSTTPSRIA